MEIKREYYLNKLNCDQIFSCVTENGEYDLGKLQTRYLSSEVACGFTGVMIALYAQSTLADLKLNIERETILYKMESFSGSQSGMSVIQ